MDRRQFLAAAAVSLPAVAVAGCNGSPESGGPVVRESFEGGLDGWETDASIGGHADVSEFDWAVERSDERAAEGAWSVEIYTEGRYDDGTAWLTRPVELPEADRFTIDVRAWSPGDSFNELRDLVVALAPDPPTSETDFPESGERSTDSAELGGLRKPLYRTDGWDEYTVEWEPDTVPETAHLAVGVTVIWEAESTHFVDDISVTAEEM